MKGVLGKFLDLGKKMLYLMLEHSSVICAWGLKSVKMQMQKLKQCSAQKKVDKFYSDLGAEIYALYKKGEEGDWKTVPSVKQKLQAAEEAAGGVAGADQAADSVQQAYLSRKQELKDKYSAKRKAVGADSPAE